jgi:2,3-bisphosphoglycerate-independent phosphoglycerate mutase
MRLNSSDPLPILAVFPSGADDVKRYAETQQLRIPAVPGIDFSALKVALTPTIIVIDGTGTIKDFWVGKLSSDEEEQVIKVAAHNKG